MKFVIVFAAVVAVCFALRAQPNPVISNDWTANITLQEAGSTFHGYVVSDVTGHRWFRFVKELNETTYTFQAWGAATTYSYTIMNSGCTCQVTPSGEISDYFASLAVATPSTKGCNGTSGTLYVNNWLPKIPVVPTGSFCVDGTTPKYVQNNDRTITFTNFKSGRGVFPLEPMLSWQDECNNACL